MAALLLLFFQRAFLLKRPLFGSGDARLAYLVGLAAESFLVRPIGVGCVSLGVSIVGCEGGDDGGAVGGDRQRNGCGRRFR